MGHLLGYARVSTTDQQPHLQVDALESAGCHRVFTETASGARNDRPTLTQLLDQLRPGDTLVVWKLDRIARSLRHLLDTVTGMAEHEVGFCSLQEQVDTTTPGGKLVFHVFAALAEFERDLVRERTSAGLAAARARGRFEHPAMSGLVIMFPQPNGSEGGGDVWRVVARLLADLWQVRAAACAARSLPGHRIAAPARSTELPPCGSRCASSLWAT